MIVIRRIVSAGLLLGSYSIHTEAGDSLQLLDEGMLYVVQDNGLVANIPAHDASATLQHVQSFHSNLQTRQSQCAENVEETRFKAHDTLITIVMPGGLLYAAAKQQQHEQAKQAYTDVTQQLQELQQDLAHFQGTSSETAFALLD
jgi:pyruvate/oxaloacetate carboxyltransferase